MKIRLFLGMTILTGIIYPLFITLLGEMTMPSKANGSILFSTDGKKIGALLIGQKFESDRYFFSRPSASDYHPLGSGGSNLGPTSEILKKMVESRKEALKKSHSLVNDQIPSELLFASGSGLDPHISKETALFQVDRVMKARGIDSSRKKEMEALIDKIALPRRFGFMGEETVNVLQLNIALDKLDVK